MPEPQRRWTVAARHELHAIADDRAALRWALGALRTACAARWRDLRLLDRGTVRWSAAALSLCCALTAIFPTLLTLAFHLQRTWLLDALGQMTPGDDWQRFVPLMQQLPAGLHALLLAAGFCYVVGTLGILGRRSAAAMAVLAGMALDLAARTFGQLVIAPADVVVHDPSLLAQLIVPVALPLLLSFAAWPLQRV
jgi:hypothetical protein